ncbi:MAG: hypothetical protein IIA58_06315 [Candidatus Marinimicrobia bacterium]|nr:hypothetical protein [Candidatus Neomarinimicrobiota bacterium]
MLQHSAPNSSGYSIRIIGAGITYNGTIHSARTNSKRIDLDEIKRS